MVTFGVETSNMSRLFTLRTPSVRLRQPRREQVVWEHRCSATAFSPLNRPLTARTKRRKLPEQDELPSAATQSRSGPHPQGGAARDPAIFEEDLDPDVSYLEQDEFEDRLAAYKKGKFNLVGVRVEAEVTIAETTQTLASPGLGGIESDSEQEYLDEIIAEEWKALRVVLKTVGVSTEELPLEVDRAWITWET